MPHIPSLSDYLSSESMYDIYLTSDTEPSPSDGPLFPAWHRARRPNNLSDVALCQKLSQWRAYHAFVDQTAAEQLRMLESNPLFQELRSRQRRRKQQLRERHRPPVFVCGSGSSDADAVVCRCPADGCGKIFSGFTPLTEHFLEHS